METAKHHFKILTDGKKKIDNQQILSIFAIFISSDGCFLYPVDITISFTVCSNLRTQIQTQTQVGSTERFIVKGG